MSGDDWGRCWVVVTGASRGLGAAICEGLARSLGVGSCVVGLARSQSGLNTTKDLVNKANQNVKFVPVVLDLGSATQEQMESALTAAFQDAAQPSRTIIFHNAGSLGNLVCLRNQSDQTHIQQYYNFNISSVVILNTVFLNLVQSRHPDAAVEVINISSLSALVPMKSWGLYCAGKAARDMLFKVLAAEEPNYLVLNYAPGPLDNEMQVAARSETGDEELRSAFSLMKDEGKLLQCSTSVNKLIEIMNARKFKSGDHVDYYDE